MEDDRDETQCAVDRLLEERAGLRPESLGRATIRHAVRKRMSACDCAAPQHYLRRLSLDAEELQLLLEELVVPETWFFRDAAVHAELRRALANRQPGARGAFRVLSVPCSTGEETYSVAMILRHAGLTPEEYWILGVDLSARAIAFAQAGTYTRRSFRENDASFAALRDRWCEPAEGSWRVGDELRRSVQFRCGNLARPDFLAGETPFDAVFCRNLLIYLHAAARGAALRNLARLLQPEGVLFTSPVEAPLPAAAGFRRLDSQCSCAFRPPDATAGTPRPSAEPQSGRMEGRRVEGASPPPAGRTSAVAPRVHRIRAAPARSTSAAPGAQAVTISANASEPELLASARQAADQGRLDAADGLCERVLAGNPTSVPAFFLRGVIRQSRGALAEAQQCFEKVLYLEPRHYKTLVHLALLAEQRGDAILAENCRRRARENVPAEVL